MLFPSHLENLEAFMLPAGEFVQTQVQKLFFFLRNKTNNKSWSKFPNYLNKLHSTKEERKHAIKVELTVLKAK